MSYHQDSGHALYDPCDESGLEAIVNADKISNDQKIRNLHPSGSSDLRAEAPVRMTRHVQADRTEKWKEGLFYWIGRRTLYTPAGAQSLQPQPPLRAFNSTKQRYRHPSPPSASEGYVERDSVTEIPRTVPGPDFSNYRYRTIRARFWNASAAKRGRLYRAVSYSPPSPPDDNRIIYLGSPTRKYGSRGQGPEDG
ncbi:uncharacterized protein FOMMEDRAFT_160701 [Fomitiporia mediterranea MF3/22]|uniref:uncharacterized protein n=1 Tax=Fomitiporia mediterranea (strain MF3/22) TaxID=694068 RepID=UPI0004407882|nr:uncharacterized protein FOMMEDRAFT_160701 [Fomitiporia mediterranea MF3/22]EJC99134.1 hypothetical protein FOMMEDRAFT_160701 [Fomitiporia mediterranea MF3/22]